MTINDPMGDPAFDAVVFRATGPVLDALLLLAARPQCEHNLNGPCRVCGRGLTLAEAAKWQDELAALGLCDPGDPPWPTS